MDEERFNELFPGLCDDEPDELAQRQLGGLEEVLLMRPSLDPVTELVLPYVPGTRPDIAERLGLSGPIVHCNTGLPTLADLEPLSFDSKCGAVLVRFLPEAIHRAVSGQGMLLRIGLGINMQPDASQVMLIPLHARDQFISQLLERMPVRESFVMGDDPFPSLTRLWSFDPGEAVMIVSIAHQPYSPPPGSNA